MGEKVGSVPLSEDLADLVNQKIKEFEKNCAEENEKSQRAQKGKARTAAKIKLKEAKQLISNPDFSGSEKVQRLWDRLQAEHEQAQSFTSQALTRQREIEETERERDSCQGELNRTLGVTNKLES